MEPNRKEPLLNGSRVMPPSQTWERIAPVLARFGVTRVGDITGLDRIGIPVWIAVRPNSRNLSVSQGKGPDSFSARVSAAMEAIELAHAERPNLRLKYATLAQLSGRERVVDLATLPRIRNSLFGDHRAVYWTQAVDLVSESRAWVPYEMVHADATEPWMPGSGSFLASTNGLASGNSLDEALLHGICELIERDALALWECAKPSDQEQRLLDLESVEQPAVLSTIGRFRAADIAVMAWDMTSDIGVAAVRVVIFDEAADSVSNPFPAAFGSGCHPDRDIALMRALIEAAQSRLTVISGSRDDFGRSRYRMTQSIEALAYHRHLVRGGTGHRPLSALPSHRSDTIQSELNCVISCLRQAGIDEVLHVNLSRPDVPLSVVRVIAPGLEGPTEAPSYMPGRRAVNVARGAIPT
jgi:ribosomal protein S12 methylthiotransferase accessory factor